MDNVVKSLKQKFKVSAEGEDRFTYIGLQIDQNTNYATDSQKQDNDIKSITIPDDVQSVSWSLAEFRHNKIVQSPHENYFNVCRQRKER